MKLRAILPGWVREWCHSLWQALWSLHVQTKAYLRFDAPAILDDADFVDERERDVLHRVFADGGRPPEQQPPPAADDPDEDDPPEDREDDELSDEDDEDSAFDVGGAYRLRQRVGFVLGPVLFIGILLLPTPAGLSFAGQATAAITAWVAVWWMSEAIPIPATSLLPIPLFPLTGALDVAPITAAYANPLVFLFMGGFFLAMAMQRWNLHRRIALQIIAAVGNSPSRLILGFMLATAFLSMWVSNTATVMMMVPIALAVIYQTADLIEETHPSVPTGTGEFSFGVALMLCIAYSASVGGVATLIGTPPNILFAGAADSLFGETVTFFEWMLYGVPIAVIGLTVVYVYVARLVVSPQFDAIPAGQDTISRQLQQLGAMTRQERLVLVVFAGMAVSWIGASLIGQADTTVLFVDLGAITVPDDIDTIIAITGALVLFTFPTRSQSGDHTFLLNWTHAVKIPWGVILLFGGGLAIAEGFQETGLAAWIGDQLTLLEGVGMIPLVLVVLTMTVFLTEVTSNTATTAMLMPILGAVAVGIGVHPYGLMIGAATVASFAFMLPVATPPNAIVFGSGYITIPQMAKVGIGLNLIGIGIVLLLVLFWLPLVWGIDISVLPEAFERAFDNG